VSRLLLSLTAVFLALSLASLTFTLWLLLVVE